jgi:hypothetical protein
MKIPWDRWLSALLWLRGFDGIQSPTPKERD